MSEGKNITEKEAKEKFFKALLCVQKEMPAFKKTADNPYYSSKYTPLEEYLDTVKPILNRYGLVLTYWTRCKDGQISVSAVISDDSDTTVETSLTFPIPEKIQQLGAVVTYLRRYTLVSLLALSSEDDDGNSVDIDPKKTPPKKDLQRQMYIDKISTLIESNKNSFTEADKARIKNNIRNSASEEDLKRIVEDVRKMCLPVPLF